MKANHPWRVLRRLRNAVAMGLSAVVLGGCGITGLTSSLGSAIFGDDNKSTPTVARVTEEQLLMAAKSGTGGGDTSALVAHGCPKMVISPNDRFLTRYEAGREGDGLAILHRGEITKTARECQIEPGRMSIKYGFSGRVLLGPRGQPGKVHLPLKVRVLDYNRSTIQAQAINVSVDIPPERPIAYFSVVRTVTFRFPEGTRPADYRLLVAFDQPGPPG